MPSRKNICSPTRNGMKSPDEILHKRETNSCLCLADMRLKGSCKQQSCPAAQGGVRPLGELKSQHGECREKIHATLIKKGDARWGPQTERRHRGTGKIYRLT